MKALEKTSFKSSTNKAIKKYIENNPNEEVWVNDIYQVAVRRGLEFGDLKMTHLSIKRLDKRAVTDWRHMQWIKNQLVGDECEGCEIFPKESRLVDAANQYHIWVFENPDNIFPFGFFDGRVVSEKSFFGETQRKFPEARKPTDLNESEERLTSARNKMLNDK